MVDLHTRVHRYRRTRELHQRRSSQYEHLTDEERRQLNRDIRNESLIPGANMAPGRYAW